MSNIDKQSLRTAAENATPGEWCTDDYHGVIADAGLNANYYIASCSGPDNRSNKRFIAAANPATVLALLDELEAKDKAWAAQDDHINQQADRIESLEKKNGDLGKALGAAEERNARAHELLSAATAENVWEIIGRLKVVISGDYRSEAEIAAAAGKGE
ncbi:TPA: ead/Ea22-like family protein [Enterobacter hormaechei]|nr:ead/Ea22-like family protein [Enterobacter hormaechei]VAM30913.1 Uncharacterised protein [Enterobacter hormaechei]